MYFILIDVHKQNRFDEILLLTGHLQVELIGDVIRSFYFLAICRPKLERLYSSVLAYIFLISGLQRIHYLKLIRRGYTAPQSLTIKLIIDLLPSLNLLNNVFHVLCQQELISNNSYCT